MVHRTQMVFTSTPPNVLILDNGGHTIKAGTSKHEEPLMLPNNLVKSKLNKNRVFISHEQDECVEKTALFYERPIERGYIVNWDLQEKIWEKVINHLSVNPEESKILLTDNNYLVPSLPDVSSEFFLETYNFKAIHKSSSPAVVAVHNEKVNKSPCSLVIDCGFSVTHVAPFVDGQLIQQAVLRIDIGGKALTNKLKDWISYRQLNVMEETHVMNECKEDVCFVSQNFEEDIARAGARFDQNDMIRRYILPDFSSRHRGSMETMDFPIDSTIQSITVNVERFSTPEILFHPSNVGLEQLGVAEAAAEAIRRCPENIRPALTENIILTGGSTKFAGFRERFVSELRSLVDPEYQIKLIGGEVDPETCTWHCAKKLVTDPTIHKKLAWINKADWVEYGDSLEYTKFFRTLLSPEEYSELYKTEEKRKKKEEQENLDEFE